MQSQFIIEPDISKLEDVVPKLDSEIFLDCPVTIIYGQTTAGKTVLCQNLLFKILLAQYDLENIYVFSSTVLKDKNWSLLLKKMDQKYPELLETNIHTSTKLLPKLINRLNNEQLMDKGKPTLILIDDLTGDKQISSIYSQLSSFCTQCRHDMSKIIILSHKFKRVSNTIRACCKQMFIGQSTENMSSVFEEIAGGYPKKAMQKMFEKEIFNDPENKYEFAVFRKDKTTIEGKFRKNFNKILNPYDYL